MFCVYLTEKNGKYYSVSSQRKYVSCSDLYICDVCCERGLTFGCFFSCRLVFAKLKLLMIAIEYKSEKRESRYVKSLQMFLECTVKICACFFFRMYMAILMPLKHFRVWLACHHVTPFHIALKSFYFFPIPLL